MHEQKRSRRRFLRDSALGAALTTAALTTNVGRTAEAGPAKTPPPRKTKIRIGMRIHRGWLESENDEELLFLKQVGVDYADITLDMIDGYRETGSFTRDALRRFVDRLGAVGLRIERANSLGAHYLNAQLGRPGKEKELEQLQRIGELLAEADIPIYGIQACQAALHYGGKRRGWSRSTGRGGYGHPVFQESEADTAGAKYEVTSDQLWAGITRIYRRVLPVLEGSKTRLAMHGNDPPLSRYLGSPQILCRFTDFDRLLAEVPSAQSGVTFCVGTRYESGEDIFEGIRHFGRAGKLFHVHFRNVRGTLPRDRGYSEVFVDEGDLSMGAVLRALDEVGYDGVIDYDHPMQVTGDGRLNKQYMAYCVGYMRGLLQSLPGSY